MHKRDFEILNGFTILYIEDEAALRKHTTAILEDFVKHIFSVEGCEEAIEILQREHIDVIIARSADFYGAGADKTFAIPMIFDKYKAGKRASWLLDASQPHSMTYTPDIGKALALLGNTHEAYNQTWHLPTDGNPLTGKAFMRAVAAAYSVSPKYSVISSWMLKLIGFFVPMIAETREMAYQFDRPYLFSSQKFEKAFFKPTPYKKAIAEIAASE